MIILKGNKSAFDIIIIIIIAMKVLVGLIIFPLIQFYSQKQNLLERRLPWLHSVTKYKSDTEVSLYSSLTTKYRQK